MRPRPPTTVQGSDFRLFTVGDPANAGVSNFAQPWLDASQIEQKIEEFITSPVIVSATAEFAKKLFAHCRVTGVLQCNVTTDYESDTEWLLLANTARVRASEIPLSHVLDAQVGEFLFLPIKRFIDLHEHEAELAKLSLTPIQSFFLFFGRMRASLPHLGGTYFRSYPSPCPREMLYHKQASKRWNGASIFYVIDYSDYLILGEHGEVGFIPIDPNQSIQPYARDFDAFLERWLSEHTNLVNGS